MASPEARLSAADVLCEVLAGEGGAGGDQFRRQPLEHEADLRHRQVAAPQKRLGALDARCRLPPGRHLSRAI
jgi:hypothetical protein